MARIRSIKPDFFTSEVIAALSLSARLTFIGLWTYVDDNGVGLDNELLVTAAVWPLEREQMETLARTREDLARLSRDGLVIRYADARKRYLFVTSWDEHQKVDHPGKKRYPRPDDPTVLEAPTCGNDSPPSTLSNASRDARESLAPEQGAGSREQGAGSRELPAPAPRPGAAVAARPPATLPGAPDKPETPAARANRLAATWRDLVPLSNFPAAAKVIRKAVDAEVADDVIVKALNELAGENRSLTTETLRVAIYGPPKNSSGPGGRKQQETDEIFDGALVRAREKDAQEARQ